MGYLCADLPGKGGPYRMPPGEHVERSRAATATETRISLLDQERIVPVAEGVDPVLAGHVRLGLPCLWDTPIVEPGGRRHMGLVVAAQHRFRSGHVGPLGEAAPPPPVVLRDGLVLGGGGGDYAGRAGL